MTSTRVTALVGVGVAAVAGSFVLAGAGTSVGASAPAQSADKSSVARAPRVGSDVFGPSVSVAPGGHGLATATCPVGTKLTGGGGTTSAFDIFFTDSFRSAGRSWTIRGTNTGSNTQSLAAFARCI